MLEIISTAHAAQATATQAAPDGGLLQMGILVVFFGIFYLLIWRPQAKRAKEHKQLISALSKGDEVVLSCGLLGKIADLDDQYVTLKTSDAVNLRFQRHAVTQVLPKGTLKTV